MIVIDINPILFFFLEIFSYHHLATCNRMKHCFVPLHLPDRSFSLISHTLSPISRPLCGLLAICTTLQLIG
jgi:hypothetical protein